MTTTTLSPYLILSTISSKETLIRIATRTLCSMTVTESTQTKTCPVWWVTQPVWQSRFLTTRPLPELTYHVCLWGSGEVRIFKREKAPCSSDRKLQHFSGKGGTKRRCARPSRTLPLEPWVYGCGPLKSCHVTILRGPWLPYTVWNSSANATVLGCAEELKRTVSKLCDALSLSFRTKGLSVPPWRRNWFMQNKWFGACRRNVDPIHSRNADQVRMAVNRDSCRLVRMSVNCDSCRLVGFDNTVAEAGRVRQDDRSRIVY